MGKSSPDPTPPRETSAATTGTNVSTAIANSFMQNMNEITPDGTRTTTQTGTEQITDPYTGQTYDVPTFTNTTTLSDGQQAIKDQQDAASLNLATLGNNQSAFLNDYMGTPFSYSPGEHENWALGLYDQLNGDKIASGREALESNLANRGIRIGSKQYDDAMSSFTSGQQDSRNNFLLDSYGTGMNTALTQRNQPINEITALLSGGQVSQPNFQSGVGVNGIQGTDNGAIIGNYDNQKMNAWQQSQAATGGFFSGLGGLFAGF